MNDKEIKELEEKQKGKDSGRTYNFYRPVGQFIEHVDTVNFSMDKDGNFLFENVGQVNSASNNSISETSEKGNEELFHFIHPEVEDDEALHIHNAIKRLVGNHKVPEICAYLKELKQKGKVMLPSNSTVMYNELARLGMPTCEGYSEKHFTNCYTK